MSLYLHTIKPSAGSTKKKKRVGRGGKRGTYSGRGLKGQKARSGVTGLKRKGMRQLIERTHKLRGFKSHTPKPAIISLAALNSSFKDNDKVTPAILVKKKLVNSAKHGVKILSNGEIKIKLNVNGFVLSKTAHSAIEKAGGTVTIKKVEDKKKKEKRVETKK